MVANSPLRILFLQTQAHWSPTAAVQHMLVRNLDQESIEVHVACSVGPRRRPTPVYLRYQEIPGIRLRPTNFGVQIFTSTKVNAAKGLVSTAIAAPTTLVGLIRYAKQQRIDIVQGSEHPRDALSGAFIARRAGARHLVHLHVKCADWMRSSTLRALRRADGIVGVSRFVADSAVSIGCDPARVHHALSALEIEAWDYRIDGNPIRDEFEIPREALVFATVGDAGGPWKGQELTLRALSEIKTRIPHFRYLVVGSLVPGVDAAYGTYLQRLAGELGLGNEVIFTGPRPDIPGVLAACDFCVMPFLDDGFGLAILEATAMKKAVVALESGGPREIVEHGRSGLLSMPGDVEGLARNIERLANDERLRDEMGAEGRRRAEEYFTPRRLASDFERIYREVVTS
jgi:glycosyltransferase involved in cell wall biosynthesis